MVCLKPSEVQRSLNNKVEIIRWIEQSNALIDFYERRAGGIWDGPYATQPRAN